MKGKKRILVCPLNWGLGHATRCIPIINTLLEQNTEVLIASDGLAGNFLKEEYPDLEHLPLPSYNIRYSSQNMIWNIASQIPFILNTIRKENLEIKQLVQKHKIDGIISDNRYGCYSSRAKSIFLSHQINIKAPGVILPNVISYFNKMFIKQFHECWIPDNEYPPRLAGELSKVLPSPHFKYIGPLSRMRKYSCDKTRDITIILSGPEPQRSLLEQILTAQLLDTDYTVLLVRGTMNGETPLEVRPGFQSIPYLTSEALNQAILSSEIIISRSGYSSIMDYASLACNAILIPTPGQTEQEYLAKYFMKEGIFYSQPQNEVNIPKAIKKSAGYTGLDNKNFNVNRLEYLIERFLKAIN